MAISAFFRTFAKKKMGLISCKPHCNWCQNRGSAYAPCDYRRYPCAVKEFVERFPDKCHDGMFMVTEKMRCPDKRFFKPIYTREQVAEHNNHK